MSDSKLQLNCPVLCLGEDKRDVSVCRKTEQILDANHLGITPFRPLECIDVNGKRLEIVSVSEPQDVGIFGKLMRRIFNLSFQAQLEEVRSLPSVSLDDLKVRLFKIVQEESEFYESAMEVSEYKTEIDAARTYEELYAIFE